MPILPTIALSLTEAEFASMADAGKAALYLRSLLSDMPFTQVFMSEIQAERQQGVTMQMATTHNSQDNTSNATHPNEIICDSTVV